jgi:hypothetical protein
MYLGTMDSGPSRGTVQESNCATEVVSRIRLLASSRQGYFHRRPPPMESQIAVCVDNCRYEASLERNKSTSCFLTRPPRRYPKISPEAFSYEASFFLSIQEHSDDDADSFMANG